MYFFFSILFLSVLFSFFGLYYKNITVRRFFFGFSVLSLSFLQGYKNLSVGTDTPMYYDIFNNGIENTIYENNIEPLFAIYCGILRVFNLEEHGFFFIALLSNLLFLLSISNLKRGKFLAVITFISFSTLYFFGFNVIRQYLALSIIAFSFSYLFAEKYLKYIFFVIIASLLHYSAIFGAFFAILFYFIKKYGFIFSVIVSFVFPFLYNIFLLKIIEILTKITSKENYNNYIELQSVSGGRFLSFIYFLFCIFLLVFRIRTKDEKFDFLICIFFCFFSFYLNINYFLLSYEGPGRVIVYTYLSLLFCFSYIKYGNVNLKILTILFLLLFFIVVFYFNFMIMNYHEVFPYSNVFF